MGWLVAAVGLMVALAAASVRELRRAPGGLDDSVATRRRRGLAVALQVLVCQAAISPLWLAMELPGTLPALPPDPPKSGLDFRFDLDLGPMIAVIVIGGILAILGLPALVGYLWGSRRAAGQRGLGVPTGQLALRVALAVVGVAMAVGVARFALSGAAPSAFSVYGAVTPDRGVAGLRARLLVDRLSDGPLTEMLPGEGLASDMKYHPGSDCCGGFAHPSSTRPVAGLRATVAGHPVVIVVPPGESAPVIEPVAMVEAPRARTPQFERSPRFARGRSGQLLFMEERAHGRVFAVLTDDRALPWAVSERTVGILLRPSAWPLLALAGVALLGAWAWRRRDTPWAPHLRLGVAAVLVHAAIFGLAMTIRYL